MYFVSTREEGDCYDLCGGAWGYYWNMEDAVDAVHRNVTDMHETIYQYAIIERLDHGLFPIPKERYWFGWNEEKDGFYEIETPKWDKKYPRFFSIALGAIGDENPTYAETLTDVADESCPNYFVLVTDSGCEKFRHCGFFKNRETAWKAVGENWGNMYCNAYDVALIECITPNVLAESSERVWFRWDKVKGGYCQSKIPKAFSDDPSPPHYPVSLF